MLASHVKSYVGFLALILVYIFPTVAVLQETTMTEIKKQREQKESQNSHNSDDTDSPIPHPYESDTIEEGDTTHRLLKKGRTNPTDKPAGLDPFSKKPQVCSLNSPECDDIFSEKSTYDEIFTKFPVNVLMKDFSFRTIYDCYKEPLEVEPAATFSFNSKFSLYCYVKSSSERKELIIPEDKNLPNNH